MDDEDAHRHDQLSRHGLRPLRLPRSAYRDLDDAGLIDAMRREDEYAIDEFLIRHQRLLYDRVRRWRVALRDVEDCVSDVIEDVAVQIVNGRIRPTRSLAAYVVKCLRTRLTAQAKLERKRRDAEASAAEEGSAISERPIKAMVSEASLQASYGVDWEPLPVPKAVERIASMLDEGLSDEERRILGWLSNFVAQRDISEWLGMSYTAGTQRIWRLRDRLRRAAREHAEHLNSIEQAELDLFFQRMAEPRSPRRSSPLAKRQRDASTPSGQRDSGRPSGQDEGGAA